MLAKISPDLKRDIHAFVMKKLEKDVQYAEIISPYKLSEQELDQYRQEVTDIKSLHVFNTVDESLMAGIIVRIGSQMIDLSLKSELEHLKHRLYEGT